MPAIPRPGPGAATAPHDPWAEADNKTGKGPRGTREPPRFTVNTSLAPGERYSHIAPHMKDHLTETKAARLFDELVSRGLGPGAARCAAARALARLVLRRVCSAEEQAELRGLRASTGVPMHLLVAFNVLVDLAAGCTSGGARVVEPGGRAGTDSRVLHFRALDWFVDSLRDLVVELEFVAEEGGPVVARSVTYFGCVGVLTGVREGLSMSLNARARHCGSKWHRRAALRAHQAMVILGWRRSISSVLRGYLLDPEPGVVRSQSPKKKKWHPGRYVKCRKNTTGTSAANVTPTAEQPREDTAMVDRILADLKTSSSSSAYLVFCTPQRVYSVEKESRFASVRTSDTFLATFNHDIAEEVDMAATDGPIKAGSGVDAVANGRTLLKAVHVEKLRREGLAARRARMEEQAMTETDADEQTSALEPEDLLAIVKDMWVFEYDFTHYSVIMDPEKGEVVWRRAYPTPLPRHVGPSITMRAVVLTSGGRVFVDAGDWDYYAGRWRKDGQDPRDSFSVGHRRYSI